MRSISAASRLRFASALRCSTTSVPRATRLAALRGRRHLEALAARERHAHVSPVPGTPARHLDVVGHHERRVEADAELADQARAVLGLGELWRERLRARARDGAEIVDQLLRGHADAGVGDRQRAGLLSGRMRTARARRRPSAPAWRSPRSAACRRHPRRSRSARAGRRRSPSRPSAPSAAAAAPPRPGTNGSLGLPWRRSWSCVPSLKDGYKTARNLPHVRPAV